MHVLCIFVHEFQPTEHTVANGNLCHRGRGLWPPKSVWLGHSAFAPTPKRSSIWCHVKRKLKAWVFSKVTVHVVFRSHLELKHDSKLHRPSKGWRFYYRAMHVVLARYCYRKSSVRPSVCLWRWSTVGIGLCWNSSKVITRIISLGSSLPRSHNIGNLVQREHPQSSGGTGVGDCSEHKTVTCNISETWQLGKVTIDDQ